MLYNVSFAGEIKKGFNAASVKQQLISHFKLQEEQINYLFSGQLITLLENISQAEALQHALEMDNIGAIIYIDSAEGAPDDPHEIDNNRRKSERRGADRRRENSDTGLLTDRRTLKDRRTPGDRRKR